MGAPVRRFLFRLLVITAMLAIAGILIFRFFLQDHYTPALPFLLIFIAAFTFLSFTWLVNTAGKGFGNFTRAGMTVTIVRLLLYAAIAVLYFLTIKRDGLTFVICLGTLYLIYTTFEVSELTRYLRLTGNKDK